jgi:hypothetical protein
VRNYNIGAIINGEFLESFGHEHLFDLVVEAAK